MGQSVKRASNQVELKNKKRQAQSMIDNTELALANDEANLDLTDLVMMQSEKIELLEAEIEKLKNGGK